MFLVIIILILELPFILVNMKDNYLIVYKQFYVLKIKKKPDMCICANVKAYILLSL